MKGIFEIVPPTPKYTTIWDVNIVLCYLEKLVPLDTLTLRDLSFKLIMLFALVTAQRAQTLSLMDTKNMIVNDNGYVFLLNKHLKQSSVSRKADYIEVKPYQHKELCIIETLREYLSRTSSLRGEETKLFLSYTKPYKAVTKQTISNWLKKVLDISGIDTSVYTAHSTRAASTSAAAHKAVHIDDIIKTAGWNNATIFAKYYNKPIIGSFSSAVLESR